MAIIADPNLLPVAGGAQRQPGATTAQAISGGEATARDLLKPDDFVKLLLAQMTHQDPLKPMETNEMMAQLAQVSQVQQAVQMNGQLTQMRQTLNTQHTGVVGSWAGREVTVRAPATEVAYSGEGRPKLGYELPESVERLQADVLDERDQTVRTLWVERHGRHQAPPGSDSDPLDLGKRFLSWDGLSDSGQPMPAGSYQVRFYAHNKQDKAAPVIGQLRGTIDHVSVVGDQPQVHIKKMIVRPQDVTHFFPK